MLGKFPVKIDVDTEETAKRKTKDSYESERFEKLQAHMSLPKMRIQVQVAQAAASPGR